MRVTLMIVAFLARVHVHGSIVTFGRSLPNPCAESDMGHLPASPAAKVGAHARYMRMRIDFRRG